MSNSITFLILKPLGRSSRDESVVFYKFIQKTQEKRPWRYLETRSRAAITLCSDDGVWSSTCRAHHSTHLLFHLCARKTNWLPIYPIRFILLRLKGVDKMIENKMFPSNTCTRSNYIPLIIEIYTGNRTERITQHQLTPEQRRNDPKGHKYLYLFMKPKAL